MRCLDVLGGMVEDIDFPDGPLLAVSPLPGAAGRIAVFLDADIAALDLRGVLRASEPHVLYMKTMRTRFLDIKVGIVYLIGGAAAEIHALSPILVQPADDVTPAVPGPVHVPAFAVVVVVVVTRHRSIRHDGSQVVVGLDVRAVYEQTVDSDALFQMKSENLLVR